MKNTLFTSFFILLFSIVFSQPSKSAKPGYLITNKNDTIWGDIQLMHQGGLFMKIKLWNSSNMNGKSYKADKVKSFCYDKRYFESLVWQDAHYYFEKIVSGLVSLYVTANTALNVVPVAGVVAPVGTTTIGEYFIVDNSGISSVKVAFFKKFMMDYVKTCPVLVDKIDKKELKFNDLKQIIEEFNLCKK